MVMAIRLDARRFGRGTQLALKLLSNTHRLARALYKQSLKERFNTIERVFGWEDKFRHLLLRFECLSELHYAFKSLAYAMINLRHFC